MTATQTAVVVLTGGLLLFLTTAAIVEYLRTKWRRHFNGVVNARDSYKTGYHLKRDEAYGWKTYAECLEFQLWSVQKRHTAMPTLTETRRNLRNAHSAPHSSVPERETS